QTVFVAAVVSVYAVPGPDMAFVRQAGIGGGARRGAAAAAGLALARAVQLTLSACGVGALLKSAPWLYEAVRGGGAL
ncbi:LysE family transporter, partial [Burkholderia pseudomallei]|uniref:LysE family transporter n=1 Tax=Burkholderia pseudomallei TaxID=28450 RepID=UPI00158C3DA8